MTPHTESPVLPLVHDSVQTASIMTLSTFQSFDDHHRPTFAARIRSARRPRVAFEGSPHGVVVSGEDGTILFVNAPASAIFDYCPAS